ncbi:hypothetical protein Dacet_0796 [Denitrovibrio acetiphilus DSM 12809]|uniref:Thioredoxin domain-containing protein n=1 Tax=Denitrovibrio acetiphilus (strain DSM 12809 / NBRC 114555 / N2460) TaxID=522772 RepID=D4H5F6_DENA2|nr:hypothetical protein [Denitrovibrio acetiphilus]ADD67576.1 hypothetical protein Dacet_0796 [Denitrovibrio acetiphilus DSM 12809]
MKVFITALALAAAVTLNAFPIRNMNKGDVVNLSKLNYTKSDTTKTGTKLLFIWNSEKRLSKKQYVSFSKLCSEKKVICLALDTAGKTSNDKAVRTLTDKTGYINDWLIVALPLTIILDSKDRIVDAFGYEGQYLEKMSETLKTLRKTN